VLRFPRLNWSQVRNLLSVAFGPIASFFLAFYLLRWASTLDRHFLTQYGYQGDYRTHPWLFVQMGFVGALPAFAGAVVAIGNRRWVGILIGILCIVTGFLCEAVVQYAPQPWFTF